MGMKEIAAPSAICIMGAGTAGMKCAITSASTTASTMINITTKNSIFYLPSNFDKKLSHYDYSTKTDIWTNVRTLMFKTPFQYLYRSTTQNLLSKLLLTPQRRYRILSCRSFSRNNTSYKCNQHAESDKYQGIDRRQICPYILRSFHGVPHDLRHR